jgi:hypothetical protein
MVVISRSRYLEATFQNRIPPVIAGIHPLLELHERFAQSMIPQCESPEITENARITVARMQLVPAQDSENADVGSVTANPSDLTPSSVQFGV